MQWYCRTCEETTEHGALSKADDYGCTECGTPDRESELMDCPHCGTPNTENDMTGQNELGDFSYECPGCHKMWILSSEGDDTPSPNGEGWSVEDERIAEEHEQARYEDQF